MDNKYLSLCAIIIVKEIINNSFVAIKAVWIIIKTLILFN